MVESAISFANNERLVITMWHGKSPISKGMGYSHGRTAQRATQDKNIRMSNKAESGMSAFGFLGFLIFIVFILSLIGVI